MHRPTFLTSLLSLLVFCSCVNMKPAIYFNNTNDSTIAARVEDLEPVIRKNDLLSISVSSLSPEVTQLFNAPNTSGVVPGYLVNQEGNIQLPLLGTIKAEGISKKKLGEDITKTLIKRELLLDPVVVIRYLNYRVTVLGEVASPSVVTAPGEKLTLMEAIGMTGDLTSNANRSNVMIVREEEGKKTIKRLDLTSTEVLTSPYYYLKSNDLVYVLPNKAKVARDSKFNRLLPVIVSTASLTFLVLDRLTR